MSHLSDHPLPLDDLNASLHDNPDEESLTHVPNDSLIDVSAEDDSLLLARSSLVAGSGRIRAAFCTLQSGAYANFDGEPLIPIEEEEEQNEGTLETSVSRSDIHGSSFIKKTKQKGFNLRKSLAWNNAFFTEEGVLDAEELSFVNKTFKETAEESKSPGETKPTAAGTRLLKPGVPKWKLSPVRLQKVASNGESLENSSPSSSSSDSTYRKTTMVEESVAKGFSLTLPKEKTPPTKKIKERLASPPVNPANVPHGQQKSFSSTVSYASRKMKDGLGLVFSGRRTGKTSSPTATIKENCITGNRRGTFEDDSSLPSLNVQHDTKGPMLARCYSHMSVERFGRLDSRESVPTSDTSSFNALAPLGTVSPNLLDKNNAKPTGSNGNTHRGKVKRSQSSPLDAFSNLSISKNKHSTPRVPSFIDGTGESLLESTNNYSHMGSTKAYRRDSTAAAVPSISDSDVMLPPTISVPFPGYAEGPMLTRCYSQLSYERLGNREGGISSNGRLPRASSTRVDGTSESSQQHGSESLMSRLKPSGLRMPSPKLGFFDKAKSAKTANVLQESGVDDGTPNNKIRKGNTNQSSPLSDNTNSYIPSGLKSHLSLSKNKQMQPNILSLGKEGNRF